MDFFREQTDLPAQSSYDFFCDKSTLGHCEKTCVAVVHISSLQLLMCSLPNFDLQIVAELPDQVITPVRLFVELAKELNGRLAPKLGYVAEPVGKTHYLKVIEFVLLVICDLDEARY